MFACILLVTCVFEFFICLCLVCVMLILRFIQVGRWSGPLGLTMPLRYTTACTQAMIKIILVVLQPRTYWYLLVGFANTFHFNVDVNAGKNPLKSDLFQQFHVGSHQRNRADAIPVYVYDSAFALDLQKTVRQAMGATSWVAPWGFWVRTLLICGLTLLFEYKWATTGSLWMGVLVGILHSQIGLSVQHGKWQSRYVYGVVCHIHTCCICMHLNDHHNCPLSTQMLAMELSRNLLPSTPSSLMALTGLATPASSGYSSTYSGTTPLPTTTT